MKFFHILQSKNIDLKRLLLNKVAFRKSISLEGNREEIYEKINDYCLASEFRM